MAQLAERSAVNRQVLGSIPSGGVFFLLNLKKCFSYKKLFSSYFPCVGGLAQSEECALCKREAPGSKPGFSIWSYSVMVITVDFESTNPGSTPGRTSFFFLFRITETENKKRTRARGGSRTHDPKLTKLVQ